MARSSLFSVACFVWVHLFTNQPVLLADSLIPSVYLHWLCGLCFLHPFPMAVDPGRSKTVVAVAVTPDAQLAASFLFIYLFKSFICYALLHNIKHSLMPPAVNPSVPFVSRIEWMCVGISLLGLCGEVGSVMERTSYLGWNCHLWATYGII